VNLNTFKTSFRRVALSGVVALAMLALPSPLSSQVALAAAPTFGNENGSVAKNGLAIQGIQTNGGNAAGGSLGGQLPEPASFTVTANGRVIAVASVTYLSTYIINLILASPVLAGEVVTFSYNAPTNDPSPNNKAIQDPQGNDAASFGPLTVIVNRSEVTAPPPAPNPESTDSGLPSAPTPTPTPTDSGLPSWDAEPLTDSETDAFTEGIWPAVIPGNIIITNEFGFTVDKNNGIKPKIRMKNYAGKITKMTISATYKDGSKTKKYKCVYAPFGSTKKAKTAKWKWYTPKKACILPAPLVASIQKGTATLSAKGKWSRQWVTSAQKTRPDKTKIKARTLRYTVKGVPS
jgi:hypothetical protein